MPKPNFFSTLFGSAGNALNMGAQMAPQMYRQKMAQQTDQRDFDAQQQYRDRQLAQNADQFRQTMEQRNQPEPEKAYRPPTVEAAYVNAMLNGDTETAGQFYKTLMERNSYEDRPVREAQPKLPPNLIADANKAYGNYTNAWANDMVPDLASDPGGTRGFMKPNPNRDAQMLDKGQFWNRDFAPMVPAYQQTFPESFGRNASESLYTGFAGQRPPQARPTMLPRTGQWAGSNPTNAGQLTPNEDSWGVMTFGDEWRTADPNKKLMAIQKARANGEL